MLVFLFRKKKSYLDFCIEYEWWEDVLVFQIDNNNGADANILNTI